MVRAIIGLLGILAALLPDKMVSVAESLAVKNASECESNSWIRPGVRVEGIIIAGATLLGGRAYAWLMNLTGVFGALIVVFPEVYRKIAAKSLYEQSADVEWNDWFADGIRLIGVVYVLMALRAYQKRRDD